MSNRSGRHSRHTAHAIPARQLIASGGTGHRAAAAIAAPRRHHAAALALATATTLAFTPVIAHQAPPLHLPTLHAPSINLTADSTQIQSLVNSVNQQLNALDAQVSDIVGIPGQTLAGALNGAATLNTGFWQTLIAGAGNNPLLVGALKSLQQLTSGGLTELATTVTAANADLTLTTGQISTLLTSTLTGSAATALTAFSGLIANPLSLSSYAALLAAPFTIAGGALTNIITAADNLGANVISLGGTIVHGATAQISNIVTSVNNLVSGVKGAIDNQTVDGLITAVQGVVAAPLNAVIAVVNGGTDAATHAAISVVDVAASAAAGVTKLWVGDGTHNGAIQAAINDIGSNPLSVGSYANAVITLAQAAITTVTGTVTTISAGLLPIPVVAAADLVNTAAAATTAFSNGLAQVAVGLLNAVGVPPLISNTMYGLATVFNTGVNVVAGAISASLNGVAGLLRTGTAITGLFTPVAATAAAVPAASNLVPLSTVKTAATAKASTGTTDPKTAAAATESTASATDTTKAKAETPDSSTTGSAATKTAVPPASATSTPVKSTAPSPTADTTTSKPEKTATPTASTATTKPSTTTKTPKTTTASTSGASTRATTSTSGDSSASTTHESTSKPSTKPAGEHEGSSATGTPAHSAAASGSDHSSAAHSGHK